MPTTPSDKHRLHKTPIPPMDDRNALHVAVGVILIALWFLVSVSPR